ncbi:hypothetical protein V8B97DRAFT_1898978 [Scleroderma yunnanense]
MHHCLEIDEILCNIYGYIDDRRTLCNIARTCRTLSEPAADFIWETLTNLIPILLQLSCVDLVQGHVSDPMRLKFTRPLTNTDWETVRRLSSRVRKLHLSDIDHNTQGMFYLSMAQDPAYIFPNLHALSIEFGLWHNVPMTYISEMLIRPHLTALRLGRNAVNCLRLDVSRVPVSLPHLRYLNIGENDDMCTIIPQLHSLESLIFRVRSWDNLRHLSHLPLLTHLMVRFPLGFSPLDNTTSGISFPKLIVLCIHHCTPELLENLLHHATFHNVTSLSVTVMNRIPSEVATNRDLLTFILTQLPHLESLRMKKYVGAFHPETWDCSAISISPYLRLLDIEASSDLALSDEGLTQMARALPHLEHLHIVNPEGPHAHLYLTLKGITSLAWHCPQLKGFKLSFDARLNSLPTDFLEKINHIAIQNNNVYYMDVLNSHVRATDRPYVARLLSKVFPYLQEIHYAKPWRWAKVAAQLDGRPARYANSDSVERDVIEEQEGVEWRWIGEEMGAPRAIKGLLRTASTLSLYD